MGPVRLQQLTCISDNPKMSLKTSLLVMMVVSLHLGLVRAGFRCTLGNWACTTSCVALGQTSGICDGEGECNCSEKSISLENFNALLPSRCHLGESFCKGTCQATGRATGKCVVSEGAKDCQCSDNFLSATVRPLCSREYLQTGLPEERVGQRRVR